MKPVTPLSLDLDNKWAYMKTHGDRAWESYPTYLDTVVSRVLPMLEAKGLRITFFIVGQDAARPENRDAIAEIAAAGHEIGNHSFHHEPWLHLYSGDEIKSDFDRAEDAIATVTGTMPRGFRGPGYSLSDDTLAELRSREYQYDATLFPNSLNPLGRLYWFMSSNLTREERRQRKALFGTVRDALRPNVPFRWDLPDGEMLEVPVTTMPLLRIPFHFSYVLWLAGFSGALAERYLRTALWLCARTANPPSLLLHPLDFLGADDEPELTWFPGMKMEANRKLELTSRMLDVLAGRYTPITLGEYTEQLDPTKTREPDFSDR